MRRGRTSAQQYAFRAIQLNRLNWRDFLRQPNPVAAALMTKMRIAPEDRPRVKLECLRLIVTLKLDPAKQALIREFMDSYLHLSESELKVYDQERKTLEPSEQEAVMQTLNEWELRGERRATQNIVLRLLTSRLGEVPEPVRGQVASLPTARLEALAEALLNFSTLSDVTRWIEQSS